MVIIDLLKNKDKTLQLENKPNLRKLQQSIQVINNNNHLTKNSQWNNHKPQICSLKNIKHQHLVTKYKHLICWVIEMKTSQLPITIRYLKISILIFCRQVRTVQLITWTKTIILVITVAVELEEILILVVLYYDDF